MEVAKKYETAIFAGGCFWCMDPPFRNHAGVTDVIAGYIGGTKPNPTYEEVSTGKTGYIEVVKVIYDPEKTSYRELLDIFWKQIDPTDMEGQFVDRGPHYKTAIFYTNEQQKREAEESKAALERAAVFKKPIITEIREATPFYNAEDYHQQYYRTSPLHYKFYRGGSGRDEFIKKTWGGQAHGTATATEEQVEKNAYQTFIKPSDEDLKKALTQMQY